MPGSAEWPMAKPDSTVVKGQSVFCYSTKKKKNHSRRCCGHEKVFWSHSADGTEGNNPGK